MRDEDANEIAALRAQVAELQQLLRESNRLATIGTVASIIAHEFNNILTPTVSYSSYALQTIRKGQPDMALIEKALAKSAAGGEKAGKICSSMLGLARGQGTHGSVEVIKLIEETLAVLAREPGKDGIALRVQVSPELKVLGDSIQLEQVLLNLLINARQAMMPPASRGGSLTVRADANSENREAVIQVTDTGPGIKPEHIEKIWQPFFTTKTRPGTKGTGLGLAICKEIVEGHNGSIDVQSQPGKGTTFTIRLPMAA